MLRLLARRLLMSVPILVIVTFVVFFLLEIAPGDPARLAAGGQAASAADVAEARHRLGLDEPLWTRYWHFIEGLFTGDLGQSIFSGQPVLSAIAERAPVSLSLMAGALIVAMLIALPAGIIAATRPGGIADRVVMLISAGGVAMPNFLIGLLLVLVFALNLQIFPATGYVPFEQSPARWFQSLVLPSVALGVAAAAEIARFLRASMLDVLDQDYIRTARAKGIGVRGVVGKHAMKNAFAPVLTVLGLQVRILLGGTVVIEQIFNLPGLGSLTVKAVFDRDYPIIQGVAISAALVVVVANILVDVAYGYLNPKLRAA
ncbi:ABC transporter permease [Actinomadura darangshiensis]|uniref:ABC transporter permease n=1 Tax=Actinomadura darangshiensis TaxID=705336 RepID=A0A4R5BD94_9ACTN|nr:ABC transporter permease [Actinomadura darangshiensis]TDD84171.1 ABC transporter permease [Actinomadura darangshiensis]